VSTLTPRDIAADLQVSVGTAQDYLKAGLIGGAFQVVENGPWRIDSELYAAWKAEKAQPSDPHKFSAPSARSQAAAKRRRAA